MSANALQEHLIVDSDLRGALGIRLKTSEPVYTVKNLGVYGCKKSSHQEADEITDNDDIDWKDENYLLQYLPEDIISTLDEEAMEAVKQVGYSIANKMLQSDTHSTNMESGIGDQEADSSTPKAEDMVRLPLDALLNSLKNII